MLYRRIPSTIGKCFQTRGFMTDPNAGKQAVIVMDARDQINERLFFREEDEKALQSILQTYLASDNINIEKERSKLYKTFEQTFTDQSHLLLLQELKKEWHYSSAN